MAGKATGPRELIDTGTHKRFVRRDAHGRFAEVVIEGRSLGRDVRQPAQTVVEKGMGDRGDQKRS
jgi:hypothetical protein